MISKSFPVDTATLPLNVMAATQQHRLLFLRNSTELLQLRRPNVTTQNCRDPHHGCSDFVTSRMDVLQFTVSVNK